MSTTSIRAAAEHVLATCPMDEAREYARQIIVEDDERKLHDLAALMRYSIRNWRPPKREGVPVARGPGLKLTLEDLDLD